MDTQMHIFPNGLRIVTAKRPGTGTVATKVFVDAGSRYDRDQPGMAHVLEHLLFQGSANQTSEEVYAAIEGVGGRIDAQTAKEYLAFSVVTDARHYRRGPEVLSNLVCQPRFLPVSLEAVMPVIRQELTRRADTRASLWDLYDLTIWQVHPLRHRVVGYERTIERLTLDRVVRHYHRHFGPRGMVIAMSGDFDVDEALALLGDHFHSARSGELMFPTLPREPALAERQVNHAPRNIGQTHLILGWPTVGMRHPDSYVLKVIERILGAGANSRLYRELRERRGLVYSVRAVRAEHAGLGHFSIYTAIDPKSARRAIAAILLEVMRLGSDLLGEAELEAAKASYEGSLAVSFETNLRMAGIIGVETLLMGRFEPFEEAARRVRTVSAADVLRVARTYFDRDRYALASLGPEDPGDTV